MSFLRFPGCKGKDRVEEGEKENKIVLLTKSKKEKDKAEMSRNMHIPVGMSFIKRH